MPETAKTKLFLNHATEDKPAFVEPLVRALEAANYDVWYDKDDLQAGLGLVQAVGEGLKQCDYGIAVFSKSYFEKKWTMDELESLYAVETLARRVIIPIWLGVTLEDVKKAVRMFVGRKGIDAKLPMPEIVNQIGMAIGLIQRAKSFTPFEEMKARLERVHHERLATEGSNRLLASDIGVKIVFDSKAALFEAVGSAVKGFSTIQAGWSVKGGAMPSNVHALCHVECPYGLFAQIRIRDVARDSAAQAKLEMKIYQSTQTTWYPSELEFHTLFSVEFVPFIVSQNEVEWSNKIERLSDTQLPEYFMRKVVEYVETVGLKGTRLSGK